MTELEYLRRYRKIVESERKTYFESRPSLVEQLQDLDATYVAESPLKPCPFCGAKSPDDEHITHKDRCYFGDRTITYFAESWRARWNYRAGAIPHALEEDR